MDAGRRRWLYRGGMTARSGLGRWGDPLLGAGLLGLGLSQLATGWRDGMVGTPYLGSRPLVVLLLAVATFSLAWRRDRPLLVVVAVAAALAGRSSRSVRDCRCSRGSSR